VVLSGTIAHYTYASYTPCPGPKYVPQDDVAKAAFKEMQIFMYAVMVEYLKMDKGKLLVSQYEKTMVPKASIVN
jgi:hypothetical protein